MKTTMYCTVGNKGGVKAEGTCIIDKVHISLYFVTNKS